MNYKFIPDSIKIDDSIPLNYSLPKCLSNFPYFTGFPVHSLVK